MDKWNLLTLLEDRLVANDFKIYWNYRLKGKFALFIKIAVVVVIIIILLIIIFIIFVINIPWP